MMDFDALVLSPNQAVFGRDVVITYAVSRPGEVSVSGRGIYVSRPIDVQMQDSTIFSDQLTTLDLRVAEWERLPARGDRIEVVGVGRFWVADSSFDGQGAVQIKLRKTEPEGE